MPLRVMAREQPRSKKPRKEKGNIMVKVNGRILPRSRTIYAIKKIIMPTITLS